MHARRTFALGALLAGVLALPVLLAPPPARGEGWDAGEAQRAREALRTAITRGRALWTQHWSPAGKACAECHGPGPNMMRSGRLKAYPRWDKAAQKVITGQQKMIQMITTKCGGQAPPMGSADLNSLEAYISTLR